MNKDKIEKLVSFAIIYNFKYKATTLIKIIENQIGKINNNNFNIVKYR